MSFNGKTLQKEEPRENFKIIMITEHDFPLLEWTGYALGEQPINIPIAGMSTKAAEFMASSKTFQGLIMLFDTDRYVGATLQQKILRKEPRPVGFYPNRNLYLTPMVARRLDNDDQLRNNLWHSLRNLPTIVGTILWKAGDAINVAYAQYTFRILSVEDTETFYKIGYIPVEDFVPNARLVMTGVFIKDTMLAFEYGFVEANGSLHVCRLSSYYGVPGADIGQYLSFTFITILAWMKNVFPNKELKPGQGINHTRQPIIIMTHQ